jgi:hypothetical protein
MVHRATVFLRLLVPVALSVTAVCLATPQLLTARAAEQTAKTGFAVAAITPSTGGHRVAPRTGVALFFGYVEFDHDPNTPGGVPGFGPWPQASQVATAP